MPPRATTRRTPQNRGDFTATERDRLTTENAEELARRQKEVGLVNQVQEMVDEEGVFDPASGALLEGPDVDAVEYVGDEDEIIDASTDPAATKREQVTDPLKDFQNPITQQAPKTRRANPRGVDVVEEDDFEPVVVEAEYVVIRASDDLEDFTFGAGNNYTLVRGRKYRLPKAVADHLDEKGYVYHGR